jgi:hypothetical protein
MIMINMITAFLPIRFGTNEGQPVLSVFVVLDISMVLTKTCHVQRKLGKNTTFNIRSCQEACPLIRENMGTL